LIGWTNLTTNGLPLLEPKLNRRRALFVIEKIDEILHWERRTERERDTHFVELAATCVKCELGNTGESTT
jgi:hypothetical protein